MGYGNGWQKMPVDLFDLARQIAAADVARQEGLRLVRKGSREWACCPFHEEKTASLCFYPDRRWYCFGCGAAGDAVAFLSALRGLTPLQAARVLVGMEELSHRSLPAKRTLLPKAYGGEDPDGFTWDRLCVIRHKADRALPAEDSPQMWEALEVRAAADDRLNNFEAGEGL